MPMLANKFENPKSQEKARERKKIRSTGSAIGERDRHGVFEDVLGMIDFCRNPPESDIVDLLIILPKKKKNG